MKRYFAKRVTMFSLACAVLPHPVIAQPLPSPVTPAPLSHGALTTAPVSPVPQPSASAVTPAPSPTASPTAIPLPSPPGIIPLPTASPSSSATPVAPASPTPSPIAATPSPYKYTYQPPVPTQDAPRIIQIDITDRFIHAGLIQLRVLADPTVTSVIVRSMGHEFAVPSLGSGVFMASNRVPSIPFFMKGRTLWVDVVASRQDGRQTIISLPVILS